MNISIIGAGKLGLPVALAIDVKGHNVKIYDINPAVKTYLEYQAIPFKEEGIEPLLEDNDLTVAASIDEAVRHADICFIAIQTPHEPQYEGATRLPSSRKDFDYTYLVNAIADVADTAAQLEKPTIVAVISTCLPGTFERDIRPLLNDYVKYVYTPQFIAMGTVIDDYLHPEFALIGVDDEEAATTLQEFYRSLFDRPHIVTDITTAEGIKVSYNTFITMKTVLANTWGELSHKLGMNSDDIYKAWSLSRNRLLSPKYLKSGVGDGGGCHPRDNIALSWLADQTELSHNIFEDLMLARELHMDWLAKEAILQSKAANLPIIILGRSFKPETNIETGSPAVLLHQLISERQPAEQYEDLDELSPAVYIIGTQHSKYQSYRFPAGSVVIDPFRYLRPQPAVKLVAIGAGQSWYTEAVNKGLDYDRPDHRTRQLQSDAA